MDSRVTKVFKYDRDDLGTILDLDGSLYKGVWSGNSLPTGGSDGDWYLMKRASVGNEDELTVVYHVVINSRDTWAKDRSKSTKQYGTTSLS